MAFPAAIQALDESILRWAQGTPHWAIQLLTVFTTLGGGWGLLLAVPWLFRKSSRLAVVWLLATELVATVLCDGLKHTFGRVRPCDLLGWCPPVLGSSPGGFSFPSGHAASSFTFCAFVSAMKPRLAPVLMPIAAAIAWSRCVLGVHYPSDVVVGAVLGTLVGCGGALLYRRHHAPPRVDVVPHLDEPDAAPPPAG